MGKPWENGGFYGTNYKWATFYVAKCEKMVVQWDFDGIEWDLMGLIRHIWFVDLPIKDGEFPARKVLAYQVSRFIWRFPR